MEEVGIRRYWLINLYVEEYKMEKRMDEKILDFINEIEEKRLRENIC